MAKSSALHTLPLTEALSNARDLLLSCRTAQGHWEGELSASALSTATAVFALAMFVRHGQRSRADAGLSGACRRLIAGGIRWLVRHQNADGGWGDTVKSVSNISTTALCWAALSVHDCAGDSVSDLPNANAAVESWLAQAAGSLDPAHLANAIAVRYGKDRTFSVPILTMCVMAGRLGPSDDAWRRIPQLPFELAACPHQLFKFLSLPVVSYALPALIAMGHARHHQCPTRNPLARLIRRLAQHRTLDVLGQIQPGSGGFLEATPLTSFVCMSLVAAGEADHPVVSNGIDFLVRSAREDGSWPIDTNLATWITTLSINALAAGGDIASSLPNADREAVGRWLLDQQYRHEHPYTHADPGAWAWTDLSGGVPDADDTAGALLSLHHLGLETPGIIAAAQAGVQWLLDVQNRDGGIPTFCRGWGALPFDRSGNDLTAHALLAWTQWRRFFPRLAPRIDSATTRALTYLASTQREDGSWVPLWFGNQHAADDENPTYGTARVLPALCVLDSAAIGSVRDRAVRWLLSAQNADGGWGAGSSTPSSIEETALAVHALCVVLSHDERLGTAISRGLNWLIERTDSGRQFEPSPIGFYFAKLWYYERDYPLIFTVAALNAALRRQCDL